jgi:ketosteroid isomerase-like protein
MISALLFIALTAQNPTVDTLRQLDSAWARSYATNDTALANKLFDDSLVVTSGNGRLKDKKGEMADVGPAQPGFQIHYFRTSDVRVQPRAGVVTGLAEWQWTFNGQTNTTRRRYTAVYTRGGPLGWRMVALHIGPAPESR